MLVMAATIGDRWRELAPELWITAGVLAATWFALIAVCAALTEPREVDPGPATLELGGPEPPAVANMIASDWRLGAEALPATLLDLAARKYLRIDQFGDRTFVRVTSPTNPDGHADGDLTDYEHKVLDHVRHLAGQNEDGAVPAEALTTGPNESSKGWWRDFRRAVESDTRERGLSRARWTKGVHTLLVSAALAVGVALGAAMSTIPEGRDDPSTSSTHDQEGSPVMLGVVVGLVGWSILVGVTEMVGRRERDTPAGREAAAKWLGLRELLGQDKIFAEQPPAGVAIWDRHLAYGAALGIAHGAVRALPLGAESDTSAWSPVTGRWRVVRIRYPRFLPGYGRRPIRAITVGLLFTAAGLLVVNTVPLDVDEVLDPLRDNGNEIAELAARDDVETVGQVVFTTVLVVFSIMTLAGLWRLALGLVDLVGGRRVVEGRVLRYRVRGSSQSPRRYVAVDDGTSDEIRAWRFHTYVSVPQGTTVRAEVTRYLQHARGFTTVTAVTATDRPSDGVAEGSTYGMSH